MLGGVLFLLRTDHGALTSLFKTPEPIQQQARYLNLLAEYNFEIQHRAGSQHGNSDGLSRRPCGSKKCSREDCEPNQTVSNQRNNKIVRPLRSGKPYKKNEPRKQQSQQNAGEIQEPADSVNELPGLNILDISWESIRQAQETDPTLKKLRELLQDPDPPTNTNEFGMGLVNLWNQRKSLEVINGVLHRNFEAPDGLILHKQILVPEPLRKKFLFWVHGDPTSGHFGVQKTTDKLQHYAYWSG